MGVWRAYVDRVVVRQKDIGVLQDGEKALVIITTGARDMTSSAMHFSLRKKESAERAGS